MIGKTLDHFRIDAKLGEGGMGVVYRATDEKLRREVALKVLPESLAADPERRARFLREARAAAAVTHNNIATVHEIGEADGHVFIAMELVRGQTLREHMATGLTHAETLRIAIEVAKGLGRAHEKGVIHRDLKPENVMISLDGDVKILDFGLAKLRETEPVNAEAAATHSTASQLTAEGRVMGTPAYMSPEQVEARTEVDARSDVFSFGVMLYEMLSGVRPFRGTTSVEILYGVLHKEPEPLTVVCPTAPAPLVAVVVRCLRKHRAERFETAKEVLLALGAESAAVPSGKALPAERIATVSGMGTALGATMAPDAPAKTSDGARTPNSTRGRRGVFSWAVGGLLVITVGALYWARLPRAPEAGIPAASAPVPAVPAPRCNAEATRLFEEGVETWETRSFVLADDVWSRAAKADPTCAPARLRILVDKLDALPTPAERVEFAEAQAHRDRLTLREAELLDAVAPTFGAHFDEYATYENLRTLARRSPDDLLTAFALGASAQSLQKRPEAQAAYERAAALDPRAGGVNAFLAQIATSPVVRDQFLDKCTHVSPRHIACDTTRSELLEGALDCPALERLGQEAVLRNPGFNSARLLLLGLAANNGSREALDEAVRHLDEEAGSGDFLRQAREAHGGVAILEADYPTAEQLLRDDPRARSADLVDRAKSASRLALLLDDTGRRHDADDLVRQTVRAGRALTRPAEPTSIVDFYARAMESGDLSRAEVDAVLASAPVTTDAAAAWSGWVNRQVTLALTADEAMKALAAMPERPVSSAENGGGWVDYKVARVRALAGDFAGAKRDAESALKRCDTLAWSAYRPRAFFLLGEVSERTGDLQSAKQAYSTVVEKWGQLKPKAVLADRARARLTALTVARSKLP